MTREEAIDILLNKTSFHPQRAEAFAKAVNALEKEPFINKPCVSSKVCEHDKNVVLDKIKENFIARYPRNYAGGLELGGRSCVFSLNDILQTIDKYKAESESEDGNAIDEPIQTLEYLRDSGVFPFSTKEGVLYTAESIDIAIETMRNYQKIEQILKDIPYGGEATVRRIQEVIEDGQNTIKD